MLVSILDTFRSEKEFNDLYAPNNMYTYEECEGIALVIVFLGVLPYYIVSAQPVIINMGYHGKESSIRQFVIN